MRELLELTRVRVLLTVREPEALFWVFAFPLVLAAVLGFAFRQAGPAPSRVAVLDGPGAAELVQRLVERTFEGSGIELASPPKLPEADGAPRLASGAIDALLVPADSAEGFPAVRFDPARPEAELARLRLEVAFERAPTDREARLSPLPTTERGSRYIDFLLPGLLGMNLMGTGMWVIGFAVAELRQRKVLKRLLVTPMNRAKFLASFLLARLVFLVAEVALLVAFGVWVLDVPFRAGLIGFALLSLLGAVTFAGLGLAVTCRVRTIQGASGVLNLAMMPMWLLSGVFFSYERFPEVLHPILAWLPLTALNDALRATMLEGRSLLDLGFELAVLGLWAAVSFALALRFFRWA